MAISPETLAVIREAARKAAADAPDLDDAQMRELRRILRPEPVLPAPIRVVA